MPLFGRQDACDRTVLRVAHRFLQVDRSQLNIVAASKGLVAGNISFSGGAGACTTVCTTTTATLIPQLAQAGKLASAAGFCVVVEKEAVFQQLLSDGCVLRGV